MDWEGDKGTFAFGRLMVPDSVSTDWLAAFENAPYREEVLLLLQNAYARGFTVAQSTRRLAYALLGDEGWLERGVGAVGNSLLVLDGDDAMLKEAFAPVWRDQIQSPGLAASLVEQRKEQMLANHGIAVDLHVRDWPFFVLDGMTRIRPEGRWNADDL
ncbi:MAG: bacillithiol biosynthesis BshC, partial [Bacteroidota bacterium]